MLKRTSRFVLEVLPFLLSALIAAILVPGVLYSRAHGLEAAAGQDIPALSQNATESLPAWIYSDPGYFALETQRVFRQAWQVVCGDDPALQH